VNKNYWKKELPNPRIMFLDIETIDLNDRRFPQPHIAGAPITHIQIMDSYTKKVIILYMQEPSEKVKEKHQNVKFVKCNNEYEMLDKFTKILHKLNPSIITAYNGNLFDFPYIFFRSMKLKFPIERLSPLNEVTFRMEFKNRKTSEYKKYYDLSKLKEFLSKENLEDWKLNMFQINVKGMYFLDYLEIFKVFTYEDLPSYKLEYLAYKFLKEGEGKVNYGQYSSIFEFYEKDYDGFFEYAIQDPIVLDNLENKLKLINTLALLAYLMGCNYDVAMSTVQPWAIHLRHIGLKNNIILPNDTRHHLDKNITGGYVKEPNKGRHSWIFSYDFNSLYPSIMDMLNLCGTTYIPFEKLPEELKEIYRLFRDENEEKLLLDKDLQNKIKELTHKYNVSFNGQGFFRRDKRGMVAQVVADIYYQRKAEKTKMLLANAILKNNEK
jgi:DNA polymerase elongation subunit (family B)